MLTVGSAKRRSARLIGRMRSVAIRPAPEWAGCSIGTAEPARR